VKRLPIRRTTVALADSASRVRRYLNQPSCFDLSSGPYHWFYPRMKQLIFVATICTAIFCGASTPLSAADLGPVLTPHVKHIRTSSRYWNWRDRCAWARQYCLYAWGRYVYHYPWDDHAYAYYPRRHRR
jgi:hypothetical protein